MAEIFNLPAVGDTMVEGEIVEWFVAVGDQVELDQAICSIETDKSVVELTTPFRGTVLHLGGGPGDVVEVGSALLVVGEAGESLPADLLATTSSAEAPPSAPVSAPEPDAPGSSVLSPVVRRLASQHDVDLATVSGSGPGGRITRADVEMHIGHETPIANGRVLAMPKVRKLARERTVDLAATAGTGPHGSITVADLDATSAAPVASSGQRRERLSAMRRSIAAHLTESVQTIPQFTSMIDVNATALLETRRALGERLEQSVPIDAILMALMIPVLRDHPIMTATLDGDEIVYYDRFDIGLAVDTPDGLIVPVVTDADSRSIAELGAEIRRLADSARSRKLTPAELSGATCTLNNVGVLGVVAGTPILPLGTSVIVGFGAIQPRVRMLNGIPLEVATMTVSATFDHRLIDGGGSGRFLAQLKQHLEVPALGLL